MTHPTNAHEFTAARQRFASYVLQGLQDAQTSGHLSEENHQAMLQDLRVTYSARMRSTLGQAQTYLHGREASGYDGTCLIKVATWGFLTLTEEERRNLATHEAAHLADAWTYGLMGHGRTWKAIHKAMGGTADRLHEGTDRGVTRKRRTRITITCGCRTYEGWTRRKLANLRGHTCRNCGTWFREA